MLVSMLVPVTAHAQRGDYVCCPLLPKTGESRMGKKKDHPPRNR
jgi:hypothetical protein